MSVLGAGLGSLGPAQLLQLTGGRGEARQGGSAWRNQLAGRDQKMGGPLLSSQHPPDTQKAPCAHPQGARQPRPPDSRKSPQNHA